MRRWLLFTSLAIAGCSAINEDEVEKPRLELTESLDATCQFPESEDLTDPKVVTDEILVTAIDCTEQQLNRAFDKLRGGQEGELTVRELKTLYDKKVFTIPGLEEPDKWEALQILVPILHPEGRAAISKAAFKSWIDWTRKYRHLYLKWMLYEGRRSKQNLKPSDPEVYQAALQANKLLSAKFWIEFGQAKNLLKVACKYYINELDRRPCSLTQDYPKHLKKLEAAWSLKGLILNVDASGDLLAPLEGGSLRKALDLGLALWKAGPLTIHWLEESGEPGKIPSALPQEWTTLAGLAEQYVQTGMFSSLDKEKLEWAIRQFESGSLYQLSADLVRLSQRLTLGPIHPGLHLASVIPLIRKVQSFAEKAVQMAKAFSGCKPNQYCAITSRQAKADPLLRRLIFKGPYYLPSTLNDGPLAKRWDAMFAWDRALTALATREAMEPLFRAFDANGDGKIALSGSTDESLAEILDLASIFLRFATLPSVTIEKDGKPTEEPVPSYVNVRPSALFQILGLIGDRWMPDSNADRWLDVDEFHSITTVYQDIQKKAASIFYDYRLTRWYPYDTPITASGQVAYPFYYQGAVFLRKGFISALVDVVGSEFPYQARHLKALPKAQSNSFFHALIGAGEKKSLKLFSGPFKEFFTTSNYYIESSDPLGPAAILSLLDRLMIKCDGNEDEKLDWREMDCAMPLVLDAGLQTVESTLIHLDPGVNDAARFLLRFLQAPGVPLSAAKLIAANGGIKFSENSPLFKDLVAYADNELSLTWDRLAFFVGPSNLAPGPSFAVWKKEAVTRFGHCDKDPKDGVLKGAIELECLVDRVMEDIQKTVKVVVGGAVNAGLDWQRHPAVRLALKLSTLANQDLDSVLETFPLSSDPSKILSLIEEMIHRGVKFEDMPE